jgi:hypothetical protein
MSTRNIPTFFTDLDHLSCRNAPFNFEEMEELLTAHSAAVYVKDRKGRTSDKYPGLCTMELYTHISAAGKKQ